jgi:hypothetical protein
MTELDYYSVMQKRIEYLAKKYDPYERFSVKQESIPEKITEQPPKKIRKKISAGYSYIISMLF